MKPGKKIVNVVPHDEWPETLKLAQARNAAKRVKPEKVVARASS